MLFKKDVGVAKKYQSEDGLTVFICSKMSSCTEYICRMPQIIFKLFQLFISHYLLSSFSRLSSGFCAFSGTSHILPICLAPSIRPSAQSLETLRREIFHFSAICVVVRYSIFPSGLALRYNIPIMFYSSAGMFATTNHSCFLVIISFPSSQRTEIGVFTVKPNSLSHFPLSRISAG